MPRWYLVYQINIINPICVAWKYYCTNQKIASGLHIQLRITIIGEKEVARNNLHSIVIAVKKIQRAGCYSVSSLSVTEWIKYLGYDMCTDNKKREIWSKNIDQTLALDPLTLQPFKYPYPWPFAGIARLGHCQWWHSFMRLQRAGDPQHLNNPCPLWFRILARKGQLVY